MITTPIESKLTVNNSSRINSFDSLIDNHKTTINLISPNYCFVCRGTGGFCFCRS